MSSGRGVSQGAQKRTRGELAYPPVGVQTRKVVGADEVVAMLGMPPVVPLGLGPHAGQPHVDGVEQVAVVARAEEEVVRLDVAVQPAAVVGDLQQRDGLDADHEDRLVREPAAAVGLQVVERGAQEVGHQHVVVVLLAVEQHARDPALASVGVLVHAAERGGFFHQVAVVTLDVLVHVHHLDCDLLPVEEVRR